VTTSEWNHQYLDANGIEIHYVRHGTGSPLVLLHGWPEFWFGWRNNIRPLAESFDVVAPDLRGFGATEKTALPDPPSRTCVGSPMLWGSTSSAS
jgi:pimeloyl-ACP methyl ester carboxylesterase